VKEDLRQAPRGFLSLPGGAVAVWEVGGKLVDANGVTHSRGTAAWLPPIHGTVVGLLENIRSEDAEGTVGPPSIFIKPASSLIGHGDEIRRPADLPAVHPEAELCVVIGRECRSVAISEALQYVGGYTVMNDVTATNLAEGTVRPSVRAKATDTFGPVGPLIVPADLIDDPGGLELRTQVNSRIVQSGGTWQYRTGIEEAIAYISSFMTLRPGDAIAMGAPPGRVDLQPGDLVTCTVQGVGELVNPVVAD
jgi:5-oxopent-3-ene-1,2,5-tricarboxylate decarboxylase/2-hydroxyhepta-2,4-diene-1,7-dioate isomerase